MVILHFIGVGISLSSKGFNYDARSKVVYNGIYMSTTKNCWLVNRKLEKMNSAYFFSVCINYILTRPFFIKLQFKL